MFMKKANKKNIKFGEMVSTGHVHVRYINQLILINLLKMKKWPRMAKELDLKSIDTTRNNH